MGLSSSKDASAASSSAAPPPSPSPSPSPSTALGVVVRRTRSAVGTRVFQSSCLGRCQSHSYQSDNSDHLPLPLPLPLDCTNKENGILSHDHPTSVTDDDNDDDDEDDNEDEDEDEDEDEVSREASKQQESCTDDDRSSSQEDAPSRPSQLRSRFTFVPGNLSFRLNRAASFGSSSSSRPSYSLFSNNAFSNATASATQQQPLPSIIRNQGSNLHSIPPCTTSDATNSDPCTNSRSVCRPHRNNVTVSNQGSSPSDFNNGDTGILPDPDYHTSSTDNNDIESIQSRRPARRIEDREPLERSVRFSRTLSVGRLRDRVLRRSSFTDGFFGHLQQDREVAGSTMESTSQVLARMPDSDENADISPVSSTHTLITMSNSMFNSQSDGLEISRSREARYHDIVQHRTDFLERRRRIRSQVRALQRLGSRFENLSGHERSCILAGQHRSGRCTCRTSNRTRNPDDDTSARASISRIVMLAEALFEVLDEIHQQSVVLSSRPSVSSLGSVPAPKEVVEAMPVKIYAELQKHQLEDVAQCYICLVEYDEGDCLRILPCQHEFHMTCIDKWLKEIHRVCPLCRGDVCRI